jgi:hypothetical protein
MLLLVDMESCEAHIVVVLERQLNRVLQCNVARRRIIACFLGCRNAGEQGHR